MVTADLKIRCWNCGREEEIIQQFVDDDVVDFNSDRPCPLCAGAWMIKKELIMSRTPVEARWN